MKSPGNVAASVRQRLLNKARSGNRSFNELLQYYAMERFLYRLSCSNSAHRFILNGALLLKVWETSEFEEIVAHLNNFLTPIAVALATDKKFGENWLAPEPWQQGS